MFIGHGVTFINDILPAGYDCRRAAADRSGLESRDDGGQKGRLDRFGSDDPFAR